MKPTRGSSWATLENFTKIVKQKNMRCFKNYISQNADKLDAQSMAAKADIKLHYERLQCVYKYSRQEKWDISYMSFNCCSRLFFFFY